MRRRWLRAAAACALGAACAAGALSATAAGAAAKPPGAAALEVPRIAYKERKLGNGMAVISVESHASPTVSVQVWYHVGGSDDPAGKSGFAHLFEHMMFKSTKYLKNEQFDRLTEDVGGNNNAFTSDDVTGYHEVVPSNHLETLLWAEAERLMNLKVDDENFKSERAVVEEEYRQRILASPYGRFFNAVRTAPYEQHSYRRGTIGSIEDLDAATLADVVAFHATYYRPDNATLVVSGDFDARQLDAWVDKYFAPIARPSAPLPARGAIEPAWTSDRSITVKAPNVPLPAVAAVWLAPPLTDADAPALQVAAALLSAGESSRLNQSLVYRQQIATQAGFNADLRTGPGLLIATAVAAGGKDPAAVRSALLTEVRRLADRPASPAELDKVKVQILTEAFHSRQTPLGLGSAIAEAAVLGGNANRVNSGYSSRLNQEIRIKRGLSYGAGSGIGARGSSALFQASVQTKNESAAEVVQLLKGELDRMMQSPASADELAARKATLIGGFSRSVETTAGLAGAIGGLVVTGRPPAELKTRIASLEAVSAQDVQGYAAAHFGAAGRRIAVAGVSERFAAALKADAPGLVTVRQDELDLERPTGLKRE